MKFRRVISGLLLVLICTMCFNVDTHADEMDNDIIDILYQKGYINSEERENAKIVEMSNVNSVQAYSTEEKEDLESFEGVMFTTAQDNSIENDILVPYVEMEDGNLVTLSSYTRAVADPRVFQQVISEIDICLVKIKVNYDFYPQNWNGYAYPFYRHGILSVSLESDTTTSNNYINNLEVRYMSRGMEVNPDTNASKNFNSVLTVLSLPTVVTNNTYTAPSGSRPYFLRDSSSAENGPAFSAVAYSFIYKNKKYDPAICVIQQDNDQPIIDFFMGLDWEF